MMRRPFIWIALLLAAALGVGSVALAMPVTQIHEQPSSQPLHSEIMAQYFPSGTELFVSLRVDDAFADQIDDLARRITGALAAYDVPTLSMRDAFAMGGFDLNAVLSWLGDYAAIGVTSLQSAMMGDASTAYIVAQVTDANAARQFFLNFGLTGDGNQLSGVGVSVNFIDGAVILSSGTNGIQLSGGSTLADDPDFQRVIDALPADGYNALVYAAESAQLSLAAGLRSAGVEQIFGESNDLAIGLTVLDDNTYTIDSAQLPAEGAAFASTPVDPAFTRYIPADANLFVQAHDLSSLIAHGIDLVGEVATISGDIGLSPENGMPSPTPVPLSVTQAAMRAQIVSMLSTVGIDLDRDILSWMKGDYALFGRADVRGIAASAIQSQPVGRILSSGYDVGFLIEATEPEKAQALVGRLDALLQQAAAANPLELSVGKETINGTNVTTVNVYAILSTYPQEDKAAFSFLLGANDDLFFFGTRGAITEILTGGDTIADTAAYAAAQPYLLPDPSTIWYTDGEGFIISVVANPISSVGVLALMGPSVGNIFTNIIGALDQFATPTPTPSPTPSPTPDVDKLLSPLDYAIAHIQHSTISASTSADGVQLIRITLTLN